MRNSENKPCAVFIGRFNKSEILTGPEKFAKRIAQKHSLINKTIFIEYFFDGSIYGLREKLFGKITESYEKIEIIRVGLFRLFFELFKLSPQILHITTYERFAVICLLYKFFSYAKIIYESHGIIRYENKELKKVSLFYRLKDAICEKLLLSFSDIIIFKSETSKNICIKYYKINNSKVKIIPNGIDKEFNNITRQTNTGILKGVIIADKTGAHTGLKYLETYLKNETPAIEIIIIGENDSANKLAEKFGLKIIKRIDTTNYAELLSGTDIFFSISSYDTFSISAAEAMAAGCITIVTKQSGISEYIKNGINGYAVNYFDVKGLNNCIYGITHNQELRCKISENACGIYRKLCWDNIYNLYKSLYIQII